MTAPEVSICIRATRRESVGEAIRSALGQTFADLEVVVSDDGVGLEDAVQAIRDPRVRYHRNATRLGDAGNTRTVFSLARGRFLTLLDDDDRLLPTFVERLLRPFRDDDDLGVAFANHYFERNGRVWPRRTLIPEGRYEEFLPTLLRHRPLAVNAAILRRDMWELDERSFPSPDGVAADLFLWLRIASAHRAFRYLDEPLAIVRLHAGQSSGSDAIRERTVATYDCFSFDDEECELLRRVRLAESLVSCAALRLRGGSAAAAEADLARARKLSPEAQRLRRLALTAVAKRPGLLRSARIAWSLYRRLRPWSNPFARREPRATRVLRSIRRQVAR